MADTRTDPAWDTLLDLGAHGDGPLHLRLVRALRAAVVEGRLAPGSTLPPSRLLAADLGCSRWAVTEAYGQLVAEGFLEARSGSGTRVRPAAVPAPRPADGPADGPGAVRPEFDLLPGLPDLRAFPRRRWADALRDAVGTLTWAELGYPGEAGHPRLRERLAAYLTRARGAAAGPADLVVTGGTRDGVLRLGHALRAAGHTHLAVEDPGWTRLAAAVTAAGLTPVPVPVDEDGLRTDVLRTLPHVRAVVVAPAHQFPTGVVLPPARRADLVAWAAGADGLVLEDDYDAEFRYDRHPVGTLQGVAPDRVALLGSTSKTLAPVLRLGWIAAPPRWTAALCAREGPGTPPPVIDQEAFAGFLGSGAYDRHLRASRLRYRRRRDHLLAALARELPGHPVTGAAAGFHLVLRLPHAPAAAVVAGAARRGLRLVDLAGYRTGPAGEGAGEGAGAGESEAVVLGYGNLSDTALPSAVALLAEAVREASGNS